jgi:pilus assembly protein CpaC
MTLIITESNKSGIMKNITTRISRVVFVTLCLLAMATMAQANAGGVLPTSLTLYEGESKVISAPDVARMSVGKTELLSTTLLKTGEVVLNADGAGETTMQVWFADGHREILSVVIVPSNGWREAYEVKQLLKDVAGIKVTTLGRRVVIDGELMARDLERVNLLKERYTDILVLARTITTEREVLEIKTFLKDIPGILVKVIDQRVVVDGNIQDRDLARITLLQERYPDILVLAREISAFEQKMIYFDVRVTEFSKDQTERLGIDWQKSFSGPTLSFARNVIVGGAVTPDLSNSSIQGAFDNYSTDNRGGGAYFGIGSELTSIIDLLEDSGAALTLTNPRLSARSGGKSDLTVGGEVPVVTSSANGNNVEYKDYGIILNLEPTLDTYNNITANISVAISQLDLANAVGGQPAFKKRATTNEVKLRPGETLVLSGLLTTEDQQATSKVKWLGSIPILGRLFRSDSFIKGETEMVIFITPTVIDKLDEGINQAEINKAAGMIDQFNNRETNGLLD